MVVFNQLWWNHSTGYFYHLTIVHTWFADFKTISFNSELCHLLTSIWKLIYIVMKFTLVPLLKNSSVFWWFWLQNSSLKKELEYQHTCTHTIQKICSQIFKKYIWSVLNKVEDVASRYRLFWQPFLWVP